MFVLGHALCTYLLLHVDPCLFVASEVVLIDLTVALELELMHGVIVIDVVECVEEILIFGDGVFKDASEGVNGTLVLDLETLDFAVWEVGPRDSPILGFDAIFSLDPESI